ncbi:unnamed protein product [Symbiodinium natans]|uniref:Pentatricopeptide repeat-containing protein, chloroplastic n=1 Tax=Symbiodinium natans TaxID=878477 RepID=A0A812JU34_9DINO|nr:unnamed protein product [Symbiodinium natans]
MSEGYAAMPPRQQARSASQSLPIWQLELQRFFDTWAQGEKPSIKFCTAVAAAMGRGKAAEAAWDFVRALQRRSLDLDTFFCNSILQACSSTSRWELPTLLLAEMLETGPWPDPASWGITMSACSRSASWQQALALMNEMGRTRSQPNVFVYGAALASCANGQWERALELLSDMRGAKVLPNVVSCSSAISACEGGAQWMFALDILRSMRRDALLPDLIAFSASMNVCARAGHWQEAIQLLAEMKAVQMQPNTVSYNSAMDACTQTSEGWAKVLQLLGDMHQEQVHLQTETCCSAIRACGLAGCWATALLLWEQLWQSPLEVDAIALGAILSACRWDVALSLLREAVADQLRPDAIHFAQSIVACEQAGRFQIETSLLDQLADELTETRLVYRPVVDPATAPHPEVFRRTPSRARVFSVEWSATSSSAFACRAPAYRDPPL